MGSEPLVIIAWVSLAAAVVSAGVIAVDIAAGRRQHMGVMNVVWPVTALYAGPLALAAYYAFGRAMKHTGGHMDGDMPKHPMWQSTALGATHCGAGCMIGDLFSDSGLYLIGASAFIAGMPLVTSYVVDFAAAYLLGIVFQYFAIVPMKHLSPGRGIWAAVKADTLSLVAFQVGMYAWMAVYQEVLFHPRLGPNSPVYWFMMQVGMLAGYATAYPMNWLLIRKGVKKSM
jgi:hypothetical protein